MKIFTCETKVPSLTSIYIMSRLFTLLLPLLPPISLLILLLLLLLLLLVLLLLDLSHPLQPSAKERPLVQPGYRVLRPTSIAGYIAQWLERLTADQQVPGSNPGVPFIGSDHSVPDPSGEHN